MASPFSPVFLRRNYHGIRGSGSGFGQNGDFTVICCQHNLGKIIPVNKFPIACSTKVSFNSVSERYFADRDNAVWCLQLKIMVFTLFYI